MLNDGAEPFAAAHSTHASQCEDTLMSDEFSIALVCLVLAGAVWVAGTRDRGRFRSLDDVVGDVAVTAAFAGCFLLTLDVTSNTGLAGAAAAAVLVTVGLSIARRRRLSRALSATGMRIKPPTHV
jgi:hypothetical protein